MVGPLGPEGLTAFWWDELTRLLCLSVSIVPHYFLILTGLNLKFSTDIMIPLIFVGAIMLSCAACCCYSWLDLSLSQSLSPMRYKYEQILTL